MRGDEIPTVRGTGENTPFARQSVQKECQPLGTNNRVTTLASEPLCFFIIGLCLSTSVIQKNPSLGISPKIGVSTSFAKA